MRRTTSIALSPAIAILAVAVCWAGSVEVQIMSPLHPKFVANDYDRIYIADFFVSGVNDVDQHVNINVNKEVKETLKSEFRERSSFEIDDLSVQYSSELDLEKEIGNPDFWKGQQIENRQRAIIVAGVIEFSNHDRGGVVTERVTNPRTGNQRMVQTSRQRIGIVLGVNLYLIDAVTGEKLFQENFKEEQVYADISNVSLPLFYDVFDKISPKIVGILVPYRVGGSRILLEP